MIRCTTIYRNTKTPQRHNYRLLFVKHWKKVKLKQGIKCYVKHTLVGPSLDLFQPVFEKKFLHRMYYALIFFLQHPEKYLRLNQHSILYITLVCLAAFGSGFTWGSVLIRW